MLNASIITVIGKSQNLPKSLTLEALFIREINPLLNTKDDTEVKNCDPSILIDLKVWPVCSSEPDLLFIILLLFFLIYFISG